MNACTRTHACRTRCVVVCLGVLYISHIYTYTHTRFMNSVETRIAKSIHGACSVYVCTVLQQQHEQNQDDVDGRKEIPDDDRIKMPIRDV